MFGQLGQSRRPVISAVFGRSTVRRGNILEEEGRCSCVTERHGAAKLENSPKCPRAPIGQTAAFHRE